MVVPPVGDTELREIRELSTITLNWIYHTFPYVGSRGEYEMIANSLPVIATFNVSKGPFTIVNIFVFVQSVRRGRGARGQRTNF